MSYPWTDLRLTQAAEVAAEHGCASAVDVESLIAEVRRLNIELRSREIAFDLRTEERDRLIRALYMVGNIDLLAQCPCCLAERTNGEWHSDDCPLVPGVEGARRRV